MAKATKAIVLVETRKGCQMMESTPRYEVWFRGVKVSELYFNMRGYVAEHGLPCPVDAESGDQAKSRGYGCLDIGERSIGAFRKKVANLNRQWAEDEESHRCQYSASCTNRATTSVKTRLVHHFPEGVVPCCEKCKTFYESH